MGNNMGLCCVREEGDDDIETQIAELRGQVQMWRACAAGLDAEKKTLDELKRRGSTEKMELRLQAADLTQKLDELADRYAQSVTWRMRSSVKHATLTKKASNLGRENERTARGNAFAIETLGPLQSHIKEGDVVRLQDVIATLTPRMVKMEEGDECKEMGELAGIVRSLYNDAVHKATGWKEVIVTMKSVVETMESSGKITRRDIKRLFTALKEACISGLSIHKSDASLTSKIEQALIDYFISEGSCMNRVQREIIHRICFWETLRDFDFTDLCQCISLVDLPETPNNEFFLSRAEVVINGHDVSEFKQILTSLDTILFFLRFLEREDLALTYTMYRSLQREPWIMEYIRQSELQYGPGRELVRTAGLNLRSEEHVLGVLEQLRISPPDASVAMRGLRSIFYSWAQIMKEKFDILVLPHHTQVVCMLICLQYVAGPANPDVGALIAEMGTGEGKSAVIASLALYCAVFLGKRVHVVVDDESLVERDFQTYRSLFGAFHSRRGTHVQAKLCVSAAKKHARFSRDDAAVLRVEEDADIVYCEAKYVQSFYTQLAKRGGVDFDAVYRDRVLILDEVDALVIGEAPNVPFVYENTDLSAFATRVAESLVRQATTEQVSAMATTGAERKVIRNMERAAQTVSKWQMHCDYSLDKDSNRYVRLQNGRACDGAWSLALEYKNYVDHYSDKVCYNERLFVMSRPRVFQKYSRIVGLSGSVGNDTERSFLCNVYNARFFKVPKFLSTCSGSNANTPQPRGVLIEEDEDAQWRTTCEQAFACRETTPVLVIARDRHMASRLAQELHCVASAKGLSGKDVVCSLSRDLCESSPDQYKENLFRCTQPLGKGAHKSFRIAVTDPRGGRGVDYRVSDPDADRAGGLTLIINHIPKCSREWIQFLGRTARQDRRGQWLAVLNRQDYADDSKRFGQELQPQKAVEMIQSWGNADVHTRLQLVHGQYHRGMRMNELSEQVAQHRLVQQPQAREAMVCLCAEYARLSVAQIDELAARVPGLQPWRIPTQAVEVGADPNAKPKMGLSKSIIFLVDRSASMLSQDAGGKTRVEVARDCIADIFERQVEEHDQIGLYSFETGVHEHFPLTLKGASHRQIASQIAGIKGERHGLTCMYDGILTCAQHMEQAGGGQKFLVTLTDGDDNQSDSQPGGEKVTALLRAGVPGLSLIFVSCGSDLKPRTLELVQYWAQLAKSAGNIGAHISARNPAQLQEAFAAVAELIDEPEGEIEV